MTHLRVNAEPRAVLITGCSSGIGLCTAVGLKARGYRVFTSARLPDDVRRLRNEGFEAVRLDLSDSGSIRAGLEQVLQASGGRLYGLFNNGAYGQPGAVEDLRREVLREQFETNVFGTHELTTLVIPVMRRQGHGRIIQNSSLLGLVSLKFRGAYNASKHALESLSDTLRLELAGTDIHVSLIEPGPILTRFRENAHAMYRKHIDPATSVFAERYRKMEARLEQEGAAVPFTLGPEAVLKKVVHALESNKPKPRYYVTFPTYLFATLKRCLSSRALDRVLRGID